MDRRGTSRPGCLVWLSLVLLLLAFIWKTLDFFVLNPAGVRAAVNDAYDVVRVHRGTIDAKKVRFLEAWSDIRENTTDDYVRRCSRPAFEDDSVFVDYSDTLHLPAFPDIVHDFRIYRIFI